MKYRKKPVVIEAVVWPGYEGTEIDAFFTEEEHRSVLRTEFPVCEDCLGECPHGDEDNAYLLIKTLEGTMRADPGDYIIRGVNQELYPCKPEIFEATYEPVEYDGS